MVLGGTKIYRRINGHKVWSRADALRKEECCRAQRIQALGEEGISHEPLDESMPACHVQGPHQARNAAITHGHSSLARMRTTARSVLARAACCTTMSLRRPDPDWPHDKPCEVSWLRGNHTAPSSGPYRHLLCQTTASLPKSLSSASNYLPLPYPHKALTRSEREILARGRSGSAAQVEHTHMHTPDLEKHKNARGKRQMFPLCEIKQPRHAPCKATSCPGAMQCALADRDHHTEQLHVDEHETGVRQRGRARHPPCPLPDSRVLLSVLLHEHVPEMRIWVLATTS